MRRFKKEMRSQGCDVSPDGSECDEICEPPVFEDPFARYVWPGDNNNDDNDGSGDTMVVEDNDNDQEE